MANFDVLLSVGVNPSQIQQQISLVNSLVKKGIASQSLGRITGSGSEFQKSLEASNARVIAFGASAGAIFTLRAAFSKLVSSVVEVESALTGINSLLQLSSGDLGKFSSGLFQVANQTGQSFADAAKAAQEFARQGLGAEQTLQRTRSALALTRLSGLGLTESVSALTATLNSFTSEALTSEDVVNRLANVDAKFAVSSGDLAEALKRVGGSANDAGVGFNQVIALVTAAQQATARGGAVIGNSFKTIFTRLQRPKVLDDLEAAGVAVKDLGGKALPTIQILSNLASTYDTLSSGQKSFIAETVGGVYQINVLKSILRDLGGGFSTYKGALDAAGESTSAAEVRMEKLNTTISSQLIKTLNSLTQAAAGVGNITIGTTIKGGLGALDGILKGVNSTFSQDGAGFAADVLPDKLAKAFATAFQGIAKGLGNIFSGPGVQFAVFGLIKLFQRLQNFVVDSVKDLTGINEKAKERQAIESLVVNILQTEKGLLGEILSGNTGLVAAHDLILNKLKLEVAQLQAIASLTPALANALQVSGVKLAPNPLSSGGRRSASGFIPNLMSLAKEELMGAHSGGYSGGPVISTSISDGNKTLPVIANGAETKSAVRVGSKTYEWINPPQFSRAGIAHAQRSKKMTGIDPYALNQSSLASEGIIPEVLPKNYPISPMARNISRGTDVRLVDNLLKYKYKKGPLTGENLDNVNETFKAAKRQTDPLTARAKILKAFKNEDYARGYGLLGSAGVVPTGTKTPSIKSTDLANVAKVIIDGVHAGDGDLFIKRWYSKSKAPQYDLTEALKPVLGSLRGQEFGQKYFGADGKTTSLGQSVSQALDRGINRKEQISSLTKSSDLPKEYVQNMLSLRGKEFAALVAFKDFTSKDPAGSGEMIGETEIEGSKFKVPFRYAGLINPREAYKSFEKESLQGSTNLKKSILGHYGEVTGITNPGQTFGNKFDEILKSTSKDLDIKVGGGNENLDILGYDPKLVTAFSKIDPFAGADVKTSLLGGDAPKEMATKISRVLALKKGTGSAEVPAFRDIKEFTGKNPGLLDYDYYKNASRSEFEALVYAAMSSGKPVRVNIGPSGAGKTTSALQLGAKPVTEYKDLERFSEYILNSSAKTNLGSGVMGTALASASQIVGFDPSKERILANLKARAEGPQPEGDRRTRAALQASTLSGGDEDYSEVFQGLKSKFSSLGRFKYASASGFIPNLSSDCYVPNMAISLSTAKRFIKGAKAEGISFERGERNRFIENNFTGEKVIETKKGSDIETVFHEIGHSISRDGADMFSREVEANNNVLNFLEPEESEDYKQYSNKQIKSYKQFLLMKQFQKEQENIGFSYGDFTAKQQNRLIDSGVLHDIKNTVGKENYIKVLKSAKKDQTIAPYLAHKFSDGYTPTEMPEYSGGEIPEYSKGEVPNLAIKLKTAKQLLRASKEMLGLGIIKGAPFSAFNPRLGAIHIKKNDPIQVAFHEIGHAISMQSPTEFGREVEANANILQLLQGEDRMDYKKFANQQLKSYKQGAIVEHFMERRNRFGIDLDELQESLPERASAKEYLTQIKSVVGKETYVKTIKQAKESSLMDTMLFKFAGGHVPNLAIELPKNSKYSNSKARLSYSTIPKEVLEKFNLKLVGSGIESVAFVTKANKNVLKVGHTETKDYQAGDVERKVHRTNNANEVFQKLNLPFFSPKAKIIKIANQSAILQKFVKDKTVYDHYDHYDHRDHYPNFIHEADDVISNNVIGSKISFDTFTKNFVVPHEHEEEFQKIIPKLSKNGLEVLQKSGIKIAAIDLAGGYVPDVKAHDGYAPNAPLSLPSNGIVSNKIALGNNLSKEVYSFRNLNSAYKGQTFTKNQFDSFQTKLTEKYGVEEGSILNNSNITEEEKTHYNYLNKIQTQSFNNYNKIKTIFHKQNGLEEYNHTDAKNVVDHHASGRVPSIKMESYKVSPSAEDPSDIPRQQFTLTTEHGSYLKFHKKDREKKNYDFEYVESFKSGDGTKLYSKLFNIMKKKKGILRSSELVPRKTDITPEHLTDDNLGLLYPQLAIREKLGQDKTSFRLFDNLTYKAKKFESISGFRKHLKKNDISFESSDILSLKNQFSQGKIPNLALGYGKFKSNFFGVKDLVKSPKETLQKLPFRVAGSLGALATGVFTEKVQKDRIGAQKFYSVARYLSGLGGVRDIKINNFKEAKNGLDLSTNDASRIQEQENYKPELFSSVGGPLFYTIGSYKMAKNKEGLSIQDAFDFDHSLDSERESKSFSSHFHLEKTPKIIKSLINKTFSVLGENGNLGYESSKKIKLGPLTIRNFKDHNLLKISGDDLNIAKYGSPFLTRIKLPEFPKSDNVKFAKGAIPSFPDFDITKIKNKKVRVSSLGKTNEFYEEQVNKISKSLIESHKQGKVEEEIEKRFSENTDYQKKIKTIFSKTSSEGVDTETLLAPQSSLRNNIKGYLGESDAIKLFKQNKIIAQPREENEYVDFTGSQGIQKYLFEIKNVSRLGRRSEVGQKFRKAASLLDFKGATNWLLTNNNTVLASSGLAPDVKLKAGPRAEGQYQSFSLGKDNGSYLDFYKSKDNKKKFEIDYVDSKKRGDGTQLYTKLFDLAKKRKASVHSLALIGQNFQPLTIDSLPKRFPQLAIREKLGLDNTSFDFLSGDVYKKFDSISNFKGFLKENPTGFKEARIKNVENRFGYQGRVPNLALGYGKFKPNFLGLKDIFADPKGTLKRLPFRIAGSVAAYGAGVATEKIGKDKLKAQQFYSASKYLAGTGGVRNIELNRGEISEGLGSSMPDLENSNYIAGAKVFSSSALFNTVGDFRIGSNNKKGTIIQDAFDFDNSRNKVESDSSKGFGEHIELDSHPILKKVVSKTFDIFGKDATTNVHYPIKQIPFGPIKLQRKIFGPEHLKYNTQFKVIGEDLDFAKYGSPFLTRIPISKIDKAASGDIPDVKLQKYKLPGMEDIKGETSFRDFVLKTENESYLQFTKPKNDNKRIHINYVLSHKKGDGTKLYSRLFDFAKKRKSLVISDTLAAQTPAALTDKNLSEKYPQLAIREKLGLDNTSFGLSTGNQYKKFESISDFREFLKEKKLYSTEINRVKNQFSRGRIPNLAISLSTAKNIIKEAKSRGVSIERNTSDKNNFDYLFQTVNVSKGEKIETALHEVGHSFNFDKKRYLENKYFEEIRANKEVLSRIDNEEEKTQYRKVATENIKSYKITALFNTFAKKLPPDVVEKIVEDQGNEAKGPALQAIKNYIGVREYVNFLKNKGNYPDITHRFASGKIPNLNIKNYKSQIKEALERENKATGGQGIISQSVKLMGPENPMGLAAIDKRSQRSADDAIMQHASLGQSMSEIRKAKTSSGYVPNLALDGSDQILISALLGAAQNITEATGSVKGTFDQLKGTLGSIVGLYSKSGQQQKLYISSQGKSVEAEREWINAIDQAKSKLLINPKEKVALPTAPGSQNIAAFSSRQAIDNTFGARVQSATKSIEDYDHAVSTQRKSLQKLGFVGSIGAGVIGGALSTGIGKISPDAGKATEELFNGLETGAQALSVFPNAVGKSVAAFFALNGLVNGVNALSNGLEKSRTAFDIQQGQSRNLVSGFDSLAASLNSLDNLILDSAVSMETLTKEQRKYQETLAKVATLSDKGKEVSEKIRTAPDTATKIKFLTEAKEEEGKKTEQSAGLLQIKELAAQRGNIVTGLFGLVPKTAVSGGIFAAKTNEEKLAATQVLQNNAFGVISSATKEQKEKLIDTVDNKEDFIKALKEIKFGSAVVSDIKAQGGTKNDVQVFFDQVRLLIGQEATAQNPKLVEARTRAVTNNEAAQNDLDNKVRNENAYRRLFINSASLQSENITTRRSLNIRSVANQDLISESSRRARTGVSNILFGEETNQVREVDIEHNRNISRFNEENENSKNKLTTDISKIFTQNFDTTLGKVKGPLGEKGINAEGPGHLGKDKIEQLDALTRGITEVVSAGNINRFEGSNGQLDIKGIEDAILSKAGGSDETQREIQGFLSSQRGSPEYLQIIAAYQAEQVKLTQDLKTQAQILNDKQDAIKEELALKREVNFLGGTRPLTDRGFRREITRKIIKGNEEFQSTDPVIKARGAIKQLEVLKAFGANPLEIAGARNPVTGKFTGQEGNANSKYTARLFNAAEAGTDKIHQDIYRDISKSTKLPSEFKNLAFGINFGKAAGSAVQAQFQPEDINSIKGTKESINASIDDINTALNTASFNLDNFSVSLGDVIEKLNKAAGDVDTSRKNVDTVLQNGLNEIKQVFTEISNQNKNNPNKTPVTQEEADRSKKTASNYSGLIQGIVTGTAVVLGSILVKKGGVSAVKGNISEIIKTAPIIGGKIAQASKKVALHDIGGPDGVIATERNAVKPRPITTQESQITERAFKEKQVIEASNQRIQSEKTSAETISKFNSKVDESYSTIASGRGEASKTVKNTARTPTVRELPSIRASGEVKRLQEMTEKVNATLKQRALAEETSAKAIAHANDNAVPVPKETVVTAPKTKKLGSAIADVYVPPKGPETPVYEKTLSTPIVEKTEPKIKASRTKKATPSKVIEKEVTNIETATKPVTKNIIKNPPPVPEQRIGAGNTGAGIQVAPELKSGGGIKIPKALKTTGKIGLGIAAAIGALQLSTQSAKAEEGNKGLERLITGEKPPETSSTNKFLAAGVGAGAIGVIAKTKISGAGKLGVGLAALGGIFELSKASKEAAEIGEKTSLGKVGVDLAKGTVAPIASIVGGEKLLEYGLAKGGKIGKVLTAGSKSVSLGKQFGLGLAFEAGNVALDAFAPTKYKKENNVFQKSQNKIEDILGYGGYVPIPAVQLATSEARLGIKIGNRAYDHNFLGSGYAADKFAGALYGVNTTDRHEEERQQKQDEADSALTPFQFKRKSIKDAIVRADKIKTEYSSPEFQKGLSGYQKSGIDRQIEKQNESLERLTKQLEALDKDGLKFHPREQLQTAQFQTTQEGGEASPIKIEISLKDADKIPEFLSTRLIKPLEEQLKTLQGRTNNIEQTVGINPQPSEL